jgi:DUF3014 family protein
MGRYDTTDTAKPVSRIVIVGLVVVIAIAAVLFYLFKPLQNNDQLEVAIITEKLSVPVKPDSLGAEDKDNYSLSGSASSGKQKMLAKKSEQKIVPDSFHLPPLNESDAIFRESLVDVSPGLEKWLQGGNLISRYLVIVNDFSQGMRIYKHMRFISLDRPFAVKQDKQGVYIDPSGYTRYNQLVAAVDAVSVQQALHIYKRFRPLMQQVFEQFGYPDDHHLDDIIKKAVANIVVAPVIEGRIALIHPTVRYKFADKNLETLDPVQKQMIRMGPENTRIIQSKLRAFIVAMIADNDS